MRSTTKRWARLLLSLSVLGAIWAPSIADAYPPGRAYAHSRLTQGGYYGVSASLETANPQVRDGGFSAEAVWIGESAKYIELGWRKESWMGEPQYYYGFWDGGGWFSGPHWLGTPGVGSTHRYRIERSSGDAWDLYIDDQRKATVYLSMAGSLLDAGGEVFSGSNAIGISGHLSLRYRTSSGCWWDYNGWHDEKVDPGYYLARLSSTAHQTGGNN